MSRNGRGKGRGFNPDKLMKELRVDAEKRGSTKKYDYSRARGIVHRGYLRAPEEAGQPDPKKRARTFALETIGARETMGLGECERLGAQNFDLATRIVMQQKMLQEPESPILDWRYDGTDDPKFVKKEERYKKALEGVIQHNNDLLEGISAAFDALEATQPYPNFARHAGATAMRSSEYLF